MRTRRIVHGVQVKEVNALLARSNRCRKTTKMMRTEGLAKTMRNMKGMFWECAHS